MTNQKGFSVLELLIAMTLGLVLMAGVVQLLMTSQSSYRDLVQQARMQEAAKVALDTIVHDLRNVGYWGCNSERLPIANSVDVAASQFGKIRDSVKGWTTGGVEFATSEYADSSSVAGSDLIELRMVDLDSEIVVTKHQPSSATIHLDRVIETPRGTIWTVVDANCSNIGVFAQVNAINSSQHNVQHIVHGTGNTGGGRINCTNFLKGNFDCSDYATNERKDTYSVGSRVFNFERVTYLVAPSKQNSQLTSLYRKTPDDPNDSEQIIDGIVALRFLYGLDLNDDQIVDVFADANTIRSNPAFAFVQAKTVQIEVDVNSLEQVGIATQTFTTSVKLRNRGLS